MDLSLAQTILGIYGTSDSFDLTVALTSCVDMKHTRRTLTPREDWKVLASIDPWYASNLLPDTCCHEVSEAKCHVPNLEKKGLCSPYFLLPPCYVFCLGDLNEGTWYGSTNKPQGSTGSAQLHPSHRRVCVTSATTPSWPGWSSTCDIWRDCFKGISVMDWPIRKYTAWYNHNCNKAAITYGFLLCFVLLCSYSIVRYCSGWNWHHELRFYSNHGQPELLDSIYYVEYLSPSMAKGQPIY